MNRLTVDCPLEIKAISDDGHIEGLAAVFGNVDFGLDRIEPGAFTDWLKSDPGSIPMLWQHRSDEPIGVWDEMAETRDGLAVAGQINQDVQRGREARSLAAQGAVTGLSIGYYPHEFGFEDDIRVLTKISVRETSLATFPMNERARVTGVKNATRGELERMLRENMGLSRKAAEALCARGIKGLRDVIGSGQSGTRTSGSGQSGDLGDLIAAAESASTRLRAKLLNGDNV